MADIYGVWLIVHHCDNDIVVYVNGVEEYRKHTERDPQLNDQQLLKNIRAGRNWVKVVCSNSPQVPGHKNPFNFEYQIVTMRIVNGSPFPPITKTHANEHWKEDDGPTGVIHDNTYPVDY